MQEVIPENMLVVQLGEGGHMKTGRVPVPRPRPGQVLVKMAAAPVNPSDLARIRQVSGTSGRDAFIPGIEGSGKVVAGGKGILPRLLHGKRVACTASVPFSGTWAEYMLTMAAHCIPLPASISDEQGAMLLVNPMTAVAFMDIANRGKNRAIINTAASSALGRMVELLARRSGIAVINIVRDEPKKENLHRQGSRYVLNSSHSGFSEELHNLAHQLNANLVLDAVGGALTRQLMQAIPAGGSILVYGNLSDSQPEIDHRSLVMDDKKVAGFYLGTWLKSAGLLKTLHTAVRVRKLLGHEFVIPISRRFPLDEAEQAIETYLADMTAGKVLLIP